MMFHCPLDYLLPIMCSLFYINIIRVYIYNSVTMVNSILIHKEQVNTIKHSTMLWSWYIFFPCYGWFVQQCCGTVNVLVCFQDFYWLTTVEKNVRTTGCQEKEWYCPVFLWDRNLFLSKSIVFILICDFILWNNNILICSLNT